MGNSVLQNEEKYFKECDKFLPERWIKANHSDACPHNKSSNPFVYLPFGFGPRACIGRRFAELELSVLLTRLLHKYRIEYHYEQYKYRSSFILTPIGELKFKMIDISN